MRYSPLTVICASLVVTACASSPSGGAYERRSARTVHQVEEGTKSGIGTAAGTVAGGVAGHATGNSQLGRTIGGVAGAVVGGVVGSAIEEGSTRQKGYEIIVRLDSGKLIAITQAADEEFHKGERVKIIHGGGVSRVAH